MKIQFLLHENTILVFRKVMNEEPSPKQGARHPAVILSTERTWKE